jgi:hypothetical protein
MKGVSGGESQGFEQVPATRFAEGPEPQHGFSLGFAPEKRGALGAIPNLRFWLIQA